MGNATRNDFDLDPAGQVMQQRGAYNVLAVLSWVQRQQSKGYLAPTLSKLVFSGCSAGSLGVQAWAFEAKTWLKWKEVGVIADSFLFVNSLEPGISAIFGPENYNTCSVSQLFPRTTEGDTFRTACRNNQLLWPDIVTYKMQVSYPMLYSFILSKEDEVQAAHDGAGATGPVFYQQASSFLDASYAAEPNFIVFLVNASQHCYLPLPVVYSASISGASAPPPSGTPFLIEWMSAFPLSQTQTGASLCAGPRVNASQAAQYAARGDIDWCSSKLVPKVFGQNYLGTSPDDRPAFHIAAPQGTWLNDPNGPFYDAETQVYHMFHQFNPNAPIPGNISWRHWYSADLVTWKAEIQLALTPGPSESPDAGGAFSGSVFLPLLETQQQSSQKFMWYTCNSETQIETQCVAQPSDAAAAQPLLADWQKDTENPILSAPLGFDALNFRDPFLWQEAAGGQALMGVTTSSSSSSSSSSYNNAVVEVFASSIPPVGSNGTLWRWQRLGALWNASLVSGYSHGAVVECPDLYPISPRDESADPLADPFVPSTTAPYVFKYSAEDTRADYYSVGTYAGVASTSSANPSNTSQSVFFQTSTGTGSASSTWLLSAGPYFSFYASKTFWDPVRRQRALVGWLPETDSQTVAQARGWQGALSVPRVVSSCGTEGQGVRVVPLESLSALRLGSAFAPSSSSVSSSGEWTQTLAADGEVGLPLLAGQLQLDLDALFSMNCEVPPPADSAPIEIGFHLRRSANGASFTTVGLLLSPTATPNPSAQLPVTLVQDTHASGGSTMSVRNETNVPFCDAAGGDAAAGGTTALRVLLDHSIVEAFVGDGRLASVLRTYALSTSDGLAVFTSGLPTGCSVTAQVAAYQIRDFSPQPTPNPSPSDSQGDSGPALAPGYIALVTILSVAVLGAGGYLVFVNWSLLTGHFSSAALKTPMVDQHAFSNSAL
jgi:beta-fructofuranosidase